MLTRLLPILGITFIDILGFSILIPLMPFFVTHFGAPTIVVGLLFAVYAGCQLIAGPIWGNVSDRLGRKRVLIISQIGATIGWTMLAFAPNIAVVFIARALEGTSGGNISVTQAYVADLVEPEKRGRAFAYIGAAFSSGLIFGPAIGGTLYAHFGYTAPFLAAAMLQVVTLVVTIVLLPESRSKEQQAEPSASFADIRLSLADKRVAPVLWQKLVYSLGLYGWFSVFTLILAARLHFDATSSSYFFAGFGVVSVVLQLGIVGRITDKLGDRRASNLGFVASTTAFLIAPFITNIPTGIAMLVVFCTGLALNNATLPSLIANASPENQRGTILGVGSSLESLSGVIMPPVSTGVLQEYGVGPTAFISAGFSAIALVMGILQTKRPETPAPALVEDAA